MALPQEISLLDDVVDLCLISTHPTIGFPPSSISIYFCSLAESTASSSCVFVSHQNISIDRSLDAIMTCFQDGSLTTANVSYNPIEKQEQNGSRRRRRRPEVVSNCSLTPRSLRPISSASRDAFPEKLRNKLNDISLDNQ